MNRNLNYAEIQSIQLELSKAGQKLVFVTLNEFEGVIIDISHKQMYYRNYYYEEKNIDKDDCGCIKAMRNNEKTTDIEFNENFYDKVKKLLIFNIENNFRKAVF